MELDGLPRYTTLVYVHYKKAHAPVPERMLRSRHIDRGRRLTEHSVVPRNIVAKHLARGPSQSSEDRLRRRTCSPHICHARPGAREVREGADKVAQAHMERFDKGPRTLATTDWAFPGVWGYRDLLSGATPLSLGAVDVTRGGERGGIIMSKRFTTRRRQCWYIQSGRWSGEITKPRIVSVQSSPPDGRFHTTRHGLV